MSGEKDISRYINSLGRALAHIHSIKTSGFGPFDSVVGQNKLKGIYPKWSVYFLKNLKEHLRLLQKAKVIDLQAHKRITKIFDKYKSKIKCFSPRLLHGDVANHNAILSSGKIVLVDWEDAVSGDPTYDIAYYASGIYTKSKWLKSFLSGYQKISPLPKDFGFRYRIYFLRIALAKALIRYKTYTISKKGLPDVHERIKNALNEISKLKVL